MNKNSILKSKIFTLQLIFGVFLMSLLSPAITFAQETDTAKVEKAEKFSPKETILEHISDSHSLHLTYVVGTYIAPLPIILYTDKGIEVFSSANLEAHEAVTPYQGKCYKYTVVHNKIKVLNAAGEVDDAASKKVWDFSITRNVASMWISILVLFIVFIGVSSSYKKRVGKAPKGLQSFLEPIILFVRDDIAIPNIGAKYARYMPLLLTFFFFILINNVLGLVPFFTGGYNLTGNIAVTITLATITLLTVNFSGNKYYWKHILAPDIPYWLYIIMVPVEIIGIISRPFALMIRLFANITAGHIIVLSLISLIFIFNTLWISPVSVLFVVFMDVIEVLVAFLQAFIFTMLSALFIGMAVEEHHH
ncbi:F0F1 ATP synthase subunit A [Mucilaginibacter sp.]|uniref:F0F1 ATP synthase subunit A n=1 Tax=Mucilaginibacter sp. TaxID=1882438 RepID=UPI0032664408